jgi:hypothetical protein
VRSLSIQEPQDNRRAVKHSGLSLIAYRRACLRELQALLSLRQENIIRME